MLLTLQIPDSPPIFPVTLEDGFIQRRRKLCPRSQRFTRIQDTLENSPNLLLRDFMRIYLGLSFPWIYVDWMKQFINHKVGVHIKSTISISYHHHHQHHHHQNHYHHHHHHTERWGSKSNLPVASPRFRIPSPGFHSFCWNTFLLQNKSSLKCTGKLSSKTVSIFGTGFHSLGWNTFLVQNKSQWGTFYIWNCKCPWKVNKLHLVFISILGGSFFLPVFCSPHFTCTNKRIGNVEAITDRQTNKQNFNL